ncbi:hypothetical protein LINGRAHAP2_LOCUS27327 [Linum grandiflorum]
MEISWLKGLLSILAQTFKIFPQNPTFISWLTILILVFNSFIYSIILVFLKLITTSLEKITVHFDLNNFRTTLATIITYELVLALVLSLASLFVATSAILGSAIIHGGKPTIITRRLSMSHFSNRISFDVGVESPPTGSIRSDDCFGPLGLTFVPLCASCVEFRASGFGGGARDLWA